MRYVLMHRDNDVLEFDMDKRDGQTYSACRPLAGAGEDPHKAWQVLAAG